MADLELSPHSNSFQSLLESGEVSRALELRIGAIEVEAKHYCQDLEAAKISSGALTVVGLFLSANPLIGVIAGLGLMGYATTLVKDYQHTKRFCPLPLLRKTTGDLFTSIGLSAAGDSMQEDPLTGVMGYVSPELAHEYELLMVAESQLVNYLNRLPADKRLPGYRHLLRHTRLRNHALDLPPLQDVATALGGVPVAPAPAPQSISPATSTQEQPTLGSWLQTENSTVQTIDVMASSSTITHANPQIAQIAQVIYNTFVTHRAPCKFIDGIDGYKFFRLTWRTEPSTSVKKVLELSDNLFAELGTILPDLAKAPLISQVKGGLLAVDVAKPNTDWRIAYFRDYITPSSFGCDVPVSLPIGVDLDGRLQRICLSEHNTRSLLVGGTPGGGKSKWAASAICAIACQYSPDSVKLVLSDVQQVEFEPFRNLPHLFAPLANTAAETVEVLQAAEIEMDKRQELFVSVGATNVDEYNTRVDKNKQVPRFVMFIEEIADIVLDTQWAGEFNRLQQRFNQVGRKWGFALIASTQSPRREVIPPLIRTLYPAFLAFMVTRPEESRIILGGQDEGAIALLGYGDAIFMTNLGRDRVQTLLVEPHEVSAIVSKVIATYGGFQPQQTRKTEKNDLDEARRRLEDSLNLPFDRNQDSSVPSVSSSPTVPSDPSNQPSLPKSDEDWGTFLKIREGRTGETVDGRKVRKSKTKICQEIFGITSDGGNSMKRAMEEYDRIRDLFVVSWIRDLLVAQTPKWEIVEEVWSISRAKQPKFKKSKPDEWQQISGLVNAIAAEFEYDSDEELDDSPANSANDSTETEEE